MKDSFKKILVLGAGPIVIGQSSELDCAGTQICSALKEMDISVVVVNPNPATVMTDKHFADAVYMEPIETESLKKIVEIEKPDGIIAAASGKKGIELCLEMEQNGDFEELHTKLLDVQPDVYKTLNSRRAFYTLLKEKNLPYLQEEIVNTYEEAEAFSASVGFPVSVRAAFSPDAGSFVACHSNKDLADSFAEAKSRSILGQVTIQKCISGYKEVHVQCLRDAEGHTFVLSTTEYMETIGIHAGDSIAVSPAQTLSQDLYEQVCKITTEIANAIDLVGTCFVRFAIDSAHDVCIPFGADSAYARHTVLSEKVTGVSLSVLCTKLAMGETFESLHVNYTDGMVATAHPVGVRIPKWSFDKFGEDVYRQLGEVMKSTGEIFAVGENFASAFYKALVSLNISKEIKASITAMSDDELVSNLSTADDRRVFTLCAALKRDIPIQTIYAHTAIDVTFLQVIQTVIQMTETEQNALLQVCTSKENQNDKKSTVLVIGAGPTSIGLGTDRDFAVSLALKALSTSGKKTAVLNDNPAAISTSDFIADSVYTEPICTETVNEILNRTKLDGVILAFGGGHAMRLSEQFQKYGVQIYGADNEVHKTLKNKLAFTDLLDELNIRHVDNHRVLVGKGAHVDVLSDGEACLIPGICEHVEKAKVHSGDSLTIYPSISFSKSVKDEITEFAQRLCRALHIKGLLNMQFVVFDGHVYVISASVVATRNIPFMTKATGLPLIELATRLMLGESLSDLGLGTGIYKEPNRFYVRVPVFSFEHLDKVDVRLGDTMRSTGEVIGIGNTYDEAIYKGFLASGMRLKRTGGVMISVADSDKPNSVAVGEAFLRQGFKIYATANTAKLLNANHVAANVVRKIHEGEPNTLHLILQNKISYLVSTAQEASNPNDDDVKIRRTALLRRIPVLPSVEMALALTECLEKNDGLEEIRVNKL